MKDNPINKVKHIVIIFIVIIIMIIIYTFIK